MKWNKYMKFPTRALNVQYPFQPSSSYSDLEAGKTMGQVGWAECWQSSSKPPLPAVEAWKNCLSYLHLSVMILKCG